MRAKVDKGCTSVRVGPACARAGERHHFLDGPWSFEMESLPRKSAGLVANGSELCTRWTEWVKAETISEEKKREVEPMNWLQMRAADASIIRRVIFSEKENVPFHTRYRCPL